MFHYLKSVFYFSNTGLNITTAFKFLSFQHATLYNKFTSLCFAFFNVIQITIYSVLLNKRTYMIFFIKRVADL